MPHRLQPNIPFDKRFVQGRITKIDHDLIHLDISDCPFAHLGRLRKEDFPNAPYKKGDKLPVFLLRATQKNAHLWHVSGKWGKKENNPWHTETFSNNDPVIGTVERFIDSDNGEAYAAILTLDNGLNAFLHKNEVPGVVFGDTLSNHLGVRDRVACIITLADKRNLKIHVSVKEWLKQRPKRFKTQLRPSLKKDDEPSSKAELPPLRFANKHFVVIDDDLGFRKATMALLETMGATVAEPMNPQALQQHLSNNTVTHALLDLNLGEHKLHEQMRDILVANHIPLAIITAEELEHETYKKLAHPAIRKPLDYGEVAAWTDGHLPANPFKETSSDTTRQTYWGFSAREKDMLQRIAKLLKRACTEAGGTCLGALWIRPMPEGTYSIRASHGMNERDFEKVTPSLSQSLVRSVISENIERMGDKRQNDPLWRLAPHNTQEIWAFPLPVENESPRAMVFFFSLPVNDDQKQILHSFKERMVDMIESIGIVRMLMDVEPFITIGRMTSGIMHEMRNATGLIQSQLEVVMLQLARAKDPQKALENTKSGLDGLHKQIAKLSKFTKLDLSRVQPHRRRILRIARTVEEIAKSMCHKAKKQFTDVSCICDLNRALTTCIEPEALEHPLLNLIDNALFYINHNSGAISVHAYVEPEDENHPVYIDVHDNGSGMTARQRETLFKPRMTAKGLQGTGLGTYISRNFLRAAGGDLELIDSVRWGGTTFRIKLPIMLEDMQDS